MEGQTFREGCDYKEKSDLKIIYWEEKNRDRVSGSFKESCDLSGVHAEQFLVEVRAANRAAIRPVFGDSTVTEHVHTNKEKKGSVTVAPTVWAWRRVGGAGN